MPQIDTQNIHALIILTAADLKELGITFGASQAPKAEPKPESRSTAPTFGEVAEELIQTIEPTWRGRETAIGWRRSIGVYAASLADIPVDQVTTDHILAVLKPMWTTLSESAAKTRERIERVLDAAKARGLRAGDNPARWKGHMVFMLPPRTHAKKHFRALPYAQIPAFMRRLQASTSMGARALEWTVLTASRESMTLGARRSEISDGIWSVPGTRMKEGQEHRAPPPRPLS